MRFSTLPFQFTHASHLCFSPLPLVLNFVSFFQLLIHPSPRLSSNSTDNVSYARHGSTIMRQYMAIALIFIFQSIVSPALTAPVVRGVHNVTGDGPTSQKRWESWDDWLTNVVDQTSVRTTPASRRLQGLEHFPRSSTGSRPRSPPGGSPSPSSWSPNYSPPPGSWSPIPGQSFTSSPEYSNPSWVKTDYSPPGLTDHSFPSSPDYSPPRLTDEASPLSPEYSPPPSSWRPNYPPTSPQSSTSISEYSNPSWVETDYSPASSTDYSLPSSPNYSPPRLTDKSLQSSPDYSPPRLTDDSRPSSPDYSPPRLADNSLQSSPDYSPPRLTEDSRPLSPHWQSSSSASTNNLHPSGSGYYPSSSSSSIENAPSGSSSTGPYSSTDDRLLSNSESPRPTEPETMDLIYQLDHDRSGDPPSSAEPETVDLIGQLDVSQNPPHPTAPETLDFLGSGPSHSAEPETKDILGAFLKGKIKRRIWRRHF